MIYKRLQYPPKLSDVKEIHKKSFKRYIPEIILLRKTIFLKDNYRYLDWKLNQTPPGTFILTIFDKKKIVATMIQTNLTLLLKSKIERCYLIGDIIVHPKYRRKGLFKTITKYLSKTKKCLYITFPNKISRIIIQQYSSYRTISLDKYNKIYDMMGMIHLFIMKITSKIKIKRLTQDIIATKTKSDKDEIKSEIDIELVETIDHELKCFLDRYNNSYNRYVLFSKDSNYIDYRYIKKPEPYSIFVIRDKKRIIACIVIQFLSINGKITKGDIYEILVIDDKEDKIIALDALDMIAKRYRLTYLVVFIHNQEIENIMKKKRFIKNPTKYIQAYMGHNFQIKSKENILDMDDDRFILSLGDSDIFN